MERPHNPSLIPVFIEAKSKDELMKKMFATNQMNGKSYNYLPPMKEGAKWVVWYYADVLNDRHVDTKEKHFDVNLTKRRS